MAYVFTGSTPFIESARDQLGFPGVHAGEVQKLPAFARAVSLAGQAAHGDRPDAERAAILVEACRHAEVLEVALYAAQDAIRSVAVGTGLTSWPGA